MKRQTQTRKSTNRMRCNVFLRYIHIAASIHYVIDSIPKRNGKAESKQQRRCSDSRNSVNEGDANARVTHRPHIYHSRSSMFGGAGVDAGAWLRGAVRVGAGG